MYGAPRFFYSPFNGPNALYTPPHPSGVAHIVNPMIQPVVIHNGFIPYAQQINTDRGHSYRYDYVTVIIMTKNISGMYEVLLPTTSHSIQLNIRHIDCFDDPDIVIKQMISDYGLTHYGKTTMLRHIEHSTGKSYKIAVVFAPRISRAIINQHYQSSHPLHRFVLPSNRVETMHDNYGTNKSLDFVTSNIIYAIANVRHTLV